MKQKKSLKKWKRAVMKRKELFAEGLLLLCALIWGMAFVAQSVAADHVGAFTFQSLRSILAFLVLLPFVLLVRKKSSKSEGNACEAVNGQLIAQRNIKRRKTLTGGVLCGIVLTIASCLQQIGVKYTTVGKAGFLTSLYLVIVAVFCVILGKKLGKSLLAAIVLAMVGIYLISGANGLQFATADVLLLLCALFFAVQIMLVDYYVKFCDPIILSCIQFMTSAILSGILMIVFERPDLQSLMPAMTSILYAGIMSSGVAYTLQIIGQKYAKPAMATLLMSFESVFSLIGGLILLNQIPSIREAFGCLIMFIAVILSQLKQHT